MISLKQNCYNLIPSKWAFPVFVRSKPLPIILKDKSIFGECFENISFKDLLPTLFTSKMKFEMLRQPYLKLTKRSMLHYHHLSEKTLIFILYASILHFMACITTWFPSPDMKQTLFTYMLGYIVNKTIPYYHLLQLLT